MNFVNTFMQACCSVKQASLFPARHEREFQSAQFIPWQQQQQQQTVRLRVMSSASCCDGQSADWLDSRHIHEWQSEVIPVHPSCM
jgi:hypothetical protein